MSAVPDGLRTTAEAAAALGLRPSSVRDLAAAGKLAPARRAYGRLFFAPAELARYAAAREVFRQERLERLLAARRARSSSAAMSRPSGNEPSGSGWTENKKNAPES